MKATIEYSLPEERRQYLEAIHAENAWGLLLDLDVELRNLVKHGGHFQTTEELASHIRTRIWEVMPLLDE